VTVLEKKAKEVQMKSLPLTPEEIIKDYPHLKIIPRIGSIVSPTFHIGFHSRFRLLPHSSRSQFPRLRNLFASNWR
jgi:hypothetical protein